MVNTVNEVSHCIILTPSPRVLVLHFTSETFRYLIPKRNNDHCFYADTAHLLTSVTGEFNYVSHPDLTKTISMQFIV